MCWWFTSVQCVLLQNYFKMFSMFLDAGVLRKKQDFLKDKAVSH